MRMLSLFAAAGLAMGSAAQAETDYTALIRDTGLTQTAATLEALPNPTPSDMFALGGVRFLGTVEAALQSLYATQINREMAMMSGLPFLRLPLPPNPDAKPFAPAQIAGVFQSALVTLAESLAALDTITADADVAVTIDTADLWFDINANGTRDAGEDLAFVAGGQLNQGLDGIPALPVVRFDTSDAAWLSAYAHMLSGISEAILAVDTTTAITRVTQSGAAIDALSGGTSGSYITSDDARWVDVIAMFIHAIEGQPDAARTQAAHAHFLGMIADNRSFWARVASETDDKREWIPNARQTSALPLDFPPDIGATWRGVLDEAEAMLKGDLLIPHWRLGSGGGINLAKAMQDPPDIDIIAIIQGEAVLPYMEKGPLISSDSLTAFNRLVGGDAALYMFVLN